MFRYSGQLSGQYCGSLVNRRISQARIHEIERMEREEAQLIARLAQSQEQPPNNE